MTDFFVSAPKKPLTYASSGVDIDAGNALVESIKPLVRSTARRGADAEIGGFGGIFDLKQAGFKDPLLVAANDGVGTKVKIAIESGIHHTIGIDLVAMCVNDIIVQGAEPLFFLDYYASGKLDPQAGVEIVRGIAAGCRDAGCALIGGETAEMPGIYADHDYDLAGFCVGAVEREKLLPTKGMQAGDIVLGLASSGVHSNGFSLVRRIVADQKLAWSDKAPFASDISLAEALLVPTRIYVRPILRALAADYQIKAMAHITGGGFWDNLPRVLPPDLGIEIDLNAWRPLPVFSWLAACGNIEPHELLRTFNCGIGMALVVPAEQAAATAAFLCENGENVTEIGRLMAHNKSQERIQAIGQLQL